MIMTMLAKKQDTIRVEKDILEAAIDNIDQQTTTITNSTRLS